MTSPSLFVIYMPASKSVQKSDGYLMGQAAEQGQTAEPLPPGLRDAQISRDWTLDT